MNKATKRRPSKAAVVDRSLYLQQLLKEIREARETPYKSTNERSQVHAFGMISAGLFLGQLTTAEYDRLWDLASNAGRYRWRELHHGQPLYTWKAPQDLAQEAAA